MNNMKMGPQMKEANSIIIIVFRAFISVPTMLALMALLTPMMTGWLTYQPTEIMNISVIATIQTMTILITFSSYVLARVFGVCNRHLYHSKDKPSSQSQNHAQNTCHVSGKPHPVAFLL